MEIQAGRDITVPPVEQIGVVVAVVVPVCQVVLLSLQGQRVLVVVEMEFHSTFLERQRFTVVAVVVELSLLLQWLLVELAVVELVDSTHKVYTQPRTLAVAVAVAVLMDLRAIVAGTADLA
jgi:hypothetical protein